MYTQPERVYIILIFGKSMNAAKLYAQKYPKPQHRTQQYFPNVENVLDKQKIDKRHRFLSLCLNDETENNVFAMVEINKTVSLREIVKNCR